MKVIFIKVEGVLNFEDSEALAPSGKIGIAESRVKDLKKIVEESGARLILFGKWCDDWNFYDEKCTPDGIYLNRKLNRRGLHIIDKVDNKLPEEEGCVDWVRRHPNVTSSCILHDLNNVTWQEW